MRNTSIIICMLFLLMTDGTTTAAAPADVQRAWDQPDCLGPKAIAVTTLPAPLDAWASLTCTPYGPMIGAHNGWIWTNPGGYSPVFIPAQMKQQNLPVAPGSVYFAKIEFQRVDQVQFRSAYEAFHSIFRNDGPPLDAYRLDVSSSNGRSLRLYFGESGNNRWGIWCNDDECDPSSWFMLLDMKHRPDTLSEKPLHQGKQ